MKKLFRYSALFLGLAMSAFFIFMAFDSFPDSFGSDEIKGFLKSLSPF